jgi:hypothetical protein
MHGGVCDRTHNPSVQLERTRARDDVKLTFIVVNEYLLRTRARDNVKLTFIVVNEYLLRQVMEFLSMSKIDYYTRWDHVKGKGRGTGRIWERAATRAPIPY